MRTHISWRIRAALLSAAFLALVAPAGALAAAPANDDLTNATQIQSLPFSDVVDTTDATQGDNEGGCGPPTHTVWYAIALPRDATLAIRVRAQGFSNPSVTLWANGQPPNASAICGGPEGDLTYRVQAGQTYYLQIGTRFFWESGGQVDVTVDEIPTPDNDSFAAATTFSQLAFSDSGNLVAATLEPNEPRASPYYAPVASVWYRYTAAESGTVAVSGSGIAVAAYSGSQLSDLTLLGFQELAYGIPLTAKAVAGTPIYFQVVPQFGGAGGPFSLRVDLAPAPTAQFSAAPFDPSIFDVIQFFDQSYDPVAIGISSWSWRFGDGGTATGCCPSHRYLADGDYTVELVVTTQDGRVASTSGGVHVQTHDVAIRELAVPMSGKVGKTAIISVGVSNSRYPELVQVQLLKSVGGSGFQPVAVSTIHVPVRKGRQMTQVTFSYTFMSDDAVLGKVSFEAIATPIGVRDAAPADNTMISPPTKVMQ